MFSYLESPEQILQCLAVYWLADIDWEYLKATNDIKKQNKLMTNQ
jgi:hypothetical protein